MDRSNLCLGSTMQDNSTRMAVALVRHDAAREAFRLGSARAFPA
jgi:hypothetical protein